MDYKKNYYQILEVPLTASKEDIRAAYRKLAKLYHPDKNAGNVNAEEKFKLINEANEILSNEILRHEYDVYRAEEERWAKMQVEKETQKDEIKQSNKKSYIKTITIVKEERIYIRGEIRVKYWADNKESAAASHETELNYCIHPTEAIIQINEQNIFPAQQIPVDYQRAYKESDIFVVPIPQPILCEVADESGKIYFKLKLNDIRIKNIKLDGVTKHENKSYGTLVGQVYGYSLKLTYEEIEEPVTDCFGETGKVERKEESGFSFIRKEYYHADCTTYWGNWIRLPKPATFRSTYQPRRRPAEIIISDQGCSSLIWIIAMLCMLFLYPRFFIACIILFGLGLLFYSSRSMFSSAIRFFSVIGALLLLGLLITAVRSASDTGFSYIKKEKKSGSVKTTRTVRQSNSATDSAPASADTLITHLVKWNDYSGKSYEGNISISIAALRNANTLHSIMNRSFYDNMSAVYITMLNNDSSNLAYLYKTFDSIRSANNLGEIAFSQVLVSAIQSQPYYLVLDKGCDENYKDEFTRNYLANCKTDCCVGNELFGVRSPVEFLSDLKGDCDTRALLLYQILKHYNYNVALLTSNYYKHAMIAVNFSEPVNENGLTITIDEKKYYMWETTNSDLNYGEVSSNFNNLALWDISLLNKN